MIAYIIRRLLIFVPMLLAISIVSFVIIQLPPGSFLEQEVNRLEAMGGSVSDEQVAELRERYGLDKPAWQQYLIWVQGIVTRGDFGESFAYKRQVNELIWSYVGFTVLITGTSLLFVYVISVPLGALAAVKKNKPTDHAIGGLSFVGMSIPEFLLALLLLVFGLLVLNYSFVGLFSPEFYFRPWSWDKFIDMLKHLPVPAAIVAVNGTAGLMRIMRGSMLDVLSKAYIQTARAKGLSQQKVVGKHAMRMAINPMISILGMSLPALLSGSAIVSIVLNLPTAGYLLFESLRTQDMYLAGTLLLMVGVLLLVGNLLADIALAIVDPRIRYD